MKKLTLLFMGLAVAFTLAGCSQKKEIMTGDMDGIKRSVTLTSKDNKMTNIVFKSTIDTRDYISNFEGKDDEAAVDELIDSIRKGYEEVSDVMKTIKGVTFTYDINKDEWVNTLAYDYSNDDKSSLEEALFISEFSEVKDVNETKKILNEMGYSEKR